MLVFYTQTITLLQTFTLLQTITLTDGLHPLYWKESKYINLFDLQSQSRAFSDILLCFVTLSVQIAAAEKATIVLVFPPIPHCLPYPLFLDQAAEV